MKRTTLLGGAAALGAVAVAGGAFFLTRDDPRERTECRVQVYFRPDASRGQIQTVGGQLDTVADATVRFVSKHEALAIMRRKYPELVKDLGRNPLPASYSAHTTYVDSCTKINQLLQPRPSGVDRVSSRTRPYEK